MFTEINLDGFLIGFAAGTLTVASVAVIVKSVMHLTRTSSGD